MATWYLRPPKVSTYWVLGNPSATASGDPLLARVRIRIGASWVQKPLFVWSGVQWSQHPVKVWDGAAWV